MLSFETIHWTKISITIVTTFLHIYVNSHYNFQVITMVMAILERWVLSKDNINVFSTIAWIFRLNFWKSMKITFS